MTSIFAWLSYSESERRKALDVVSLFAERDTRDELGLGVVRDALADLLFPGTSTIQTRARYFLFVPWTYQRLESRRIPSAQVSAKARAEELDLIDALADSEDTRGVIGIEARRGLRRLPSNIYWQGLSRWRIRLYQGTQDQYHRSLDRQYARADHTVPTEDPEYVGNRRERSWHAGLPPRPSDFPNEASFKLRRDEADYLRERVLVSASSTVLAHLASEPGQVVRTDYPWEYPRYGELTAHLKEQLDHARCFSEVMHGAALLYNLMLARLRAKADLVETYELAMSEWAHQIVSRHSALQRWDRTRFWAIVDAAGGSVSIPTRQFVESWATSTLNGNPRGLASDARAKALIRDRERALKRGQARLENQRALELWGGAAGAAAIDYRWGTVQTLVGDIHAGLQVK